MITIDHEKCIRCGICVRTCHENCIALVDEGLSINHNLCSTCTQCIAVCPQQALSWDGALSVPYDETQLPGPENLDELFKQRRTIRKFKEMPIERPLLEAIVSYGIYAPTNNYGLRAIVKDDVDVIHELDQIGVKFVSKIYRLIFKLYDFFM